MFLVPDDVLPVCVVLAGHSTTIRVLTTLPLSKHACAQFSIHRLINSLEPAVGSSLPKHGCSLETDARC